MNRRERLFSLLREKGRDSGIIILPGNEESPRNYKDNCYPFRQDASFLYYIGLAEPGLAAVMDVDEGKTTLYGNNPLPGDEIWTGFKPSLSEKAARSGITDVACLAALKQSISSCLQKKRRLFHLPPYRSETVLFMAGLTGWAPETVQESFSEDLADAVITMRSVKEAREIREMEKAADMAADAYAAFSQVIAPGVHETVIKGIIEGEIAKAGGTASFPPIVTVRGDILHNHDCSHVLKDGDLFLVDSGAETSMGYASDFTRVYPVSGRFSGTQKTVYNIVLKAQETAISMMKPGVSFKNIHLMAANIIAEGLKDMGILKGDMDEAVNLGAHALFSPHGLGHLIGLDVHDMESIGENRVGYGNEAERSAVFGHAALRFARKLCPGHTITVEPGIYFITGLIDAWASQGKFKEFINYSALEKLRNFGGIRIEDDVLVTADGPKILGKPVLKHPDDIESLLGG